jgi:hypothetical protein
MSTITTQAVEALRTMRRIVDAEQMIFGNYIEPGDHTNPKPRPDRPCGGNKMCAIGALWVAAGVDEVIVLPADDERAERAREKVPEELVLVIPTDKWMGRGGELCLQSYGINIPGASEHHREKWLKYSGHPSAPVLEVALAALNEAARRLADDNPELEKALATSQFNDDIEAFFESWVGDRFFDVDEDDEGIDSEDLTNESKIFGDRARDEMDRVIDLGIELLESAVVV